MGYREFRNKQKAGYIWKEEIENQLNEQKPSTNVEAEWNNVENSIIVARRLLGEASRQNRRNGLILIWSSSKAKENGTVRMDGSLGKLKLTSWRWRTVGTI